MAIRTIVVHDVTGTEHTFTGEEYDFWHEGHLCRVYSHRERGSIASFSSPISVVRLPVEHEDAETKH